MALEESRNSYYLYCLSYGGLWSVKIPNFNQLDKHQKPELKMGCVFTSDRNLLPIHMGLLSSGRNVYMVGGKDYHPIFHFEFKPSYKSLVLDPTSIEEEFPVKNPQFLYKPVILPASKMKPVVSPMVIQANHQIYILTQYTNPWFGRHIEGICFQSFDPIKNCLHILPSPPYKSIAGQNKGTGFRVVAHFAVCGYIYLFIQEDFHQKNQLAFSFNTRSLEWKEINSMVDKFRKKRIPIPFLHRGDTGVSQEFSHLTRILVSLSDNTPTAYLVTLGPDGYLKPRSFRFLKETRSDVPRNFIDPTCIAQLHDIGSGRFCTIYQSFDVPLKVYVFKIDFATERAIQISPKDSPRRSSVILCSRKFSHNIPSFYAFCLASAPASQSPGNQIAAAEEQDRDGKMDKATCKRKRYWEEEHKGKQDRDGKMDKATCKRKRYWEEENKVKEKN